MSEMEEHEFIKEYLTGMGVSEQEQKSLTVYNFGYDGPLPFPSISLTPDSTLRLNLQTSGIQTQSRRSIAVVGEKYVGRFQELMFVVDRIHEDTQALPFVIFVETEEEIQIKNVTSHMTPALVGTKILFHFSFDIIP